MIGYAIARPSRTHGEAKRTSRTTIFPDFYYSELLLWAFDIRIDVQTWLFKDINVLTMLSSHLARDVDTPAHTHSDVAGGERGFESLRERSHLTGDFYESISSVSISLPKTNTWPAVTYASGRTALGGYLREIRVRASDTRLSLASIPRLLVSNDTNIRITVCGDST